jgi:tryptophan-rich sensory protein
MIIGCIWALLWILICVLAVVLYLEPARKSLKRLRIRKQRRPFTLPEFRFS